MFLTLGIYTTEGELLLLLLLLWYYEYDAYIKYTEPGEAFGEVALLTDDGTRSASIITDQPTDLIVIDRALYSRCVKDVIAREFQQKADFIAQHPQFRSWAPKYRKQLAMALEKEVLSFEHIVTKQGAPVDAIYFIVSSVHSLIRTFCRG